MDDSTALVNSPLAKYYRLHSFGNKQKKCMFLVTLTGLDHGFTRVNDNTLDGR